MKQKNLFENQPIQKSKKDYETVTSKIVNSLRKCKDVISIYQLGSTSCPGISDIDLIIVTDHPSKDLKKTIQYCLSKYSYFLTHYLFIVNTRMIKDIDYMIKVYDLKKIYGKTQKINKINPVNNSNISIAITTDYINMYWGREFFEMMLGEKIYFNSIANRVYNDLKKTLRIRKATGTITIPVRESLLKLNSVCYGLSMYTEFTKKNIPAWKKFTKEVKNLRKNWFLLEPNKRLKQLVVLIKQAASISYELIDMMDKLLKKHIRINTKKRINAKMASNYFINQYSSEWDKEKAKKNILKKYEQTGIVTAELPTSLLAQLLEYRDIKKMMPKTKIKEIKKTLKIKNNQFLECIKKRYDLLGQQVQLLNSHGFEQGHFMSFHYPFSNNSLAYNYFRIIKKIRRMQT